jgi:uncharacterized membrane protein
VLKTIRTTIIGGVFFLIPLAFLALVLGKAFQISMMIAEPIDALIPVDMVGGVALATALAVLILLIVCFLAGLLARQARFAVFTQRLDEALIAVLPGYAIAKSMIGGLVQAQDAVSALKPVLVRFDDYSQIAFEVERTEAAVTVFLPGAPAAWSGSSVFVAPERVTPVDLPPHEVVKELRLLGRGGVEKLGETSGRGAADPVTVR